MRKRISAVATLALVAATLAGCGGGGSEAEGSRSETATVDGSVPFDRAFIDGMVPHHRSAIEMAEAAQQAGVNNPQLVSIVLNIVDSQQQEIDQMLEWRKQWYRSDEVDADGADALGMSRDEMGMSHSSSDFSNVDDVDGAFAAMMIDHHQGAIAMARMARDQATHAEIKKLARRIIAAQQREIKTMKPLASDEAMDGMEGMNH